MNKSKKTGERKNRKVNRKKSKAGKTKTRTIAEDKEEILKNIIVTQ